LLANVLGGRDIADARRDDSVERAQLLRRGKPSLLSRRPRESTTRAEESISGVEIDNGKPSEVVGTDAGGDTSPRSSAPMVPPGLPPRVSLDPKGLSKPDLRQPDPDNEEHGETLPVSPVIPKQAPVTSGTQTPPIDSAEFKKRLTELDVDLTSMVAEESSKWNLSPLQQRAEELVETGPSPLERGKARLLLDRIAEFASTLPPSGDVARPAQADASGASPVIKRPDFAAQYDAVGYLMPIVGARPGAPQYHLTDKDGRSLSLVTARPGINLNAYVKKQVGLYGQRGFVDTLKKQHILAERVVNLDVQRR
jgi:hypothetical protein